MHHYVYFFSKELTRRNYIAEQSKNGKKERMPVSYPFLTFQLSRFDSLEYNSPELLSSVILKVESQFGVGEAIKIYRKKRGS